MLEINNLTSHRISEKFLRKVARIVLKGEKKKEVQISLAFVGEKRIKELNKKYLNRNRVTDVLSFPESKFLLKKTKELNKMESLGEIVICLNQIKKNAKRFNSQFKTELSRILIHGILHLLDYDHEKSQKMEKKENYYLSLAFHQRKIN